MKVQFLRQMAQDVSSRDAVPFAVERRAEDSDSHAVIYDRENTASDATFRRNPYVDGKFAGTVIHSAGKHDRLYDFDNIFVQQTLTGNRMDSVGSCLLYTSPSPRD